MKKAYKISIVFFILLLLLASGFMYIMGTNVFRNINQNVFKNIGGGKKLVIGGARDPITLDPANATDMDSFKVAVNIFETLVKYEKDGRQIIPSLAVNWKSSEDGLTWLFYLRQGVKFHDGTDFDANAVVLNFQRWMDKDNINHDGQFSYWNYISSSSPGLIKDISALSTYTLEIKLSKPYAPFLNTLAMPAFSIASPEALKKYGKEIDKHPVGTGPFCFESWEPNKSLILTRNKKYWNTPAKVDEVEFKVIPSNKERLAQLSEGKILIADNLGPDDVNEIENNSAMNLLLRPYFNVGYIAINNEKSPYNNRLVRTAISYAINKDELIREVFSNLARPAKTLIPTLLSGYNEGIEPSEYNIKRSMELLKEAGYPKGFKTTLWVMDCPRNYFPKPVETAEYIKKSLKEINIEVSIVTFEWDEYLERIGRGEHELALIGWTGDNIDPDNFLNTLLSSDNAKKGMASNYSFYKNTEVDLLLKQARQTNDMEFRKNLYRNLLSLVNSDIPSIPLVHTMPVMAKHSSVKGYLPYITGVESLENVDIEIK